MSATYDHQITVDQQSMNAVGSQAPSGGRRASAIYDQLKQQQRLAAASDTPSSSADVVLAYAEEATMRVEAVKNQQSTVNSSKQISGTTGQAKVNSVKSQM